VSCTYIIGVVGMYLVCIFSITTPIIVVQNGIRRLTLDSAPHLSVCYCMLLYATVYYCILLYTMYIYYHTHTYTHIHLPWTRPRTSRASSMPCLAPGCRSPPVSNICASLVCIWCIIVSIIMIHTYALHLYHMYMRR
jgi:hypothetical protein